MEMQINSGQGTAKEICHWLRWVRSYYTTDKPVCLRLFLE